MSYNHIIIDTDAIVYKAACSCQKTTYHVMLINEFGEDGLIEIMSTEKQAKGLAASISEPTYIVKSCMIDKPYILYARIRELIKGVLTNLNCSSYTLVLGNEAKESCFRFKVAKTQPYKGNRSEASRPLLLKMARDYIIDKYNPEIAPPELESDDLLGIMLTEDPNAILAGIDKDLDMIPGWHYNIDSRRVYFAKDPGELELLRENRSSPKLQGTGYKWWCAQLLLGDIVDNIKGIKGLGPVKVYELLNPLDTESALYQTVQQVYNDKDTIEHFEENKQLLWIKRYKDETV